MTNQQLNNGNFTVILKSEVLKGRTTTLTRKRNAKEDGLIKKYKARLNIDELRMKRDENYNETYSPVPSWNSVRSLLTMTVAHG